MDKTKHYKEGKISVHTRPESYPLTSQQLLFRRIVKECGIKKGISKEELQGAMIGCVGPRMREESQFKKDVNIGLNELTEISKKATEESKKMLSSALKKMKKS